MSSSFLVRPYRLVVDLLKKKKVWIFIVGFIDFGVSAAVRIGVLGFCLIGKKKRKKRRKDM